jgi:hypothetical protein
MSVEELMAMVHRHYGVLDDDSPLPPLPTKVVPWASLPRTPPEALARLEQAKANARTYNRLYDEAGAYIAQKSRGQPTATDECKELVDAHGTVKSYGSITD